MEPRPVVLVTGASRRVGIGSAVARRLGQDGWDVALTGWRPYDESMPWGSDPDELNELVQEIGESGARTTLTEVDLGLPDAAAKVFDDTEDQLGPVTAMVVVHTHDPGGGLLDLSAADIDRHLAVNVRATLQLVAEFARRFTGPPGRGRVVTFTSGLPLVGSIAYAASKGAIEWITVSAAAELAPRITVNAVNPGPNDTAWMPDDVKARIRQESPMGRVGVPQDAANLVSFLCSEAGGWMTGQILSSDGGWSKLRG